MRIGNRKWRPMRDWPRWARQIVEQAIHLTTGFLLAWLGMWNALWAMGATSAAMIGIGFSAAVCLIREFYVQLPIRRPLDTALDTFCWILGAVQVLWLVG